MAYNHSPQRHARHCIRLYLRWILNADTWQRELAAYCGGLAGRALGVLIAASLRNYRQKEPRTWLHWLGVACFGVGLLAQTALDMVDMIT